MPPAPPPADSSFAHLLSGRLLARNAVLNVVGLATPILAALVCIPILVSGLGTEKFGVLTLGWVVIGYFSFFDFGLGRALTKVVSDRLGNGGTADIPRLTWTASVLMFVLGIVGAILFIALTPWLVIDLLKISPELQREAITSFYIMGACLPWVISTAGFRGLLEAHQKFGSVNALRAPMGVFNFAGPALVLPFSTSLVAVILAIAGLRVVAWGAHVAVCLRAFPALRQQWGVCRQAARELVTVGGWMTVSNVISPFMSYLDRFFIGAMISVTAVAYYVTPYEVISKLMLIPISVVGVLFPAFALSSATERRRTAELFDKGLRIIFLAVLPPTLLAITLAPEALYLWLGQEFAVNSARVLQLLAIGIFINALAQIPFSAVQGMGRADLTGKLHLIELPFYLVALWFLAERFGIAGVALVWVLRVSVDAAVLVWLAARGVPDPSALMRQAFYLYGGGVVALGLAFLPQGPWAKGAFLLLAAVAYLAIGWQWVLKPEERLRLRAARRTPRGPGLPNLLVEKDTVQLRD